jgi:hypothetical protein
MYRPTLRSLALTGLALALALPLAGCVEESAVTPDMWTVTANGQEHYRFADALITGG